MIQTPPRTRLPLANNSSITIREDYWSNDHCIAYQWGQCLAFAVALAELLPQAKIAVDWDEHGEVNHAYAAIPDLTNQDEWTLLDCKKVTTLTQLRQTCHRFSTIALHDLNEIPKLVTGFKHLCKQDWDSARRVTSGAKRLPLHLRKYLR